MKRLLPLAAIVVLMVPAMAVLGGTPYEYYMDKFDEVSFRGSNGSLVWENSWIEFGDEIQGPDDGNVHVGSEDCSGSKCLHLEGELLDLDYYGVYRSADLSMFEQAELCFDVRVSGVSSAVLRVYVSPDGNSWERKASYQVLSEGEFHETIDLHGFLTEGFALKFKVEAPIGGEIITIDNVELKGTLASTSTSSTSSTSTSSTSTSTTSTSTSTSTTTTVARSASTTTSSTSTTRPLSAAATSSSTTTTTAATTTTTSSGTGAGVPPQPPFDSGLRDTPAGLMADYEEGMMGDMGMEQVEVLGAEITADFSMAVEYFEAAKVWVAVLVLFVTAAAVSGMDWRRSRERHG